MTTPTTSPVMSYADPALPKPARRIPLPGLWVWLACFLLALVANAPALKSNDFLWLDRDLVMSNTLLNTLAGVQRIWFGIVDPSTYPLPQYSPLTQSLFYLDGYLWRGHLWGYRLTTILLHASAAAVLWQLLRRLAVPGALAIVFLFVVHPITVESVTLLAERRNPLAALLGLSAVYLLLRGAGVIDIADADVLRSTNSEPSDRPKIASDAPAATQFLPDDPARLYAMGAALFVVGLFASAAIATLPLVMLLVAWWKKGRPAQALAAISVGLSVAGFAMLSVTSTIEKNRAGVDSPTRWNRADSSAGELAVRTQVAGRAVAFYAGKMIFPLGLAIDYPRWQTPPDIERLRAFSADAEYAAKRSVDVAPGRIVAYLWPLGVAGAVVGLWVARRQIGATPAIFVTSFVLLLAPALGFIDLGWMRYGFVADRAAYLAVIPFVTGVVLLGVRLFILATDTLDRVTAGTTAGVAVVACLIIAATLSARASESDWRFWLKSANAVRDARSWMPRYELAESLFRNDAIYPNLETIKGAQEALDAARRTRPDEPGPLLLAGKLATRRGDAVEGMRLFEEAMEKHPTYAPAYFAAGELFRFQANLRPTDPKPRGLAYQSYRRTTELDPLDATAFVRLGETAFEIARRLDPEHEEIPLLIQQALESFDAAVQLRPYDVDLLLDVSKLLLRMERAPTAAPLLLTAQRLAPRRADVSMVVADAMLQIGDLVHGETALIAAIQNDPRRTQAYINLGQLRKAQKRWDEARHLLTKALELEPTNAEAIKALEEVEAGAKG